MINTPEFNTFVGSMFDTKLKQGNLSTNSHVIAVSQRVNKNKENIKNYKCFIWFIFFVKAFLVMIVWKHFFQPKFSTTDKISAPKSKVVNTSKLFHYTIFYVSFFTYLLTTK